MPTCEDLADCMVGATGIEPVTPTMSISFWWFFADSYWVSSTQANHAFSAVKYLIYELRRFETARVQSAKFRSFATKLLPNFRASN
jgi:hypothetical protein